MNAMEIKYKIFEQLVKKGIAVKDFQNDLSFGGSVMNRLRHNTPVKIDTIGRICEYLQCPIQDVVEITYDKIDKVAQTEKQIAELQEKLQRLKSE